MLARELQSPQIPDLCAFSVDPHMTGDAFLENASSIVPLIAVRIFLDELLPPLPSTLGPDIVSDVFSILDGKTYLKDRWSAIPDDPKKASGGENNVFTGLLTIATAVENAVLKITEARVRPTVELVHDTYRSPVCVMRQAKSQPDGCFILARREFPNEPSAHWMDVALTGEYKRSDQAKDINDDIKKILWNMHHIMREDPRRRFCYSFTVEDRNIRFWFASRAEILVSEAFDFVRDPKTLIHFLLSIMYARPDQLGWDPTMKVIHGGKEPQYDITVFDDDGRTQTYRTVELISNVGTFVLRGRGTRVWKVQKLDANGEPLEGFMALKEAWIDTDRGMEHQNLDTIRGDARRAGKKGMMEVFDTHLLHYDFAGEVVIDGSPDRTMDGNKRDRIRFPESRRFNLIQREEDEKYRRKREREAEQRRSEARNTSMDYRDYEPRRIDRDYTYGPRSHYRIVFTEVCTPLTAISDLRQIFWCISKIALVLRALHLAGWVHRDISPGNIFLLGDKVKLADLEYVKRIDKNSSGSHEIRTGTMAFTSVEARDHCYLFRAVATEWSSVSLPDDLVEDDDDDDVEVDELTGTPDDSGLSRRHIPKPTPKKDILWRYNPLHDIESLWWIMLFFVLYKDIVIIYRTMGAASSASSGNEIQAPQQETEMIRAQRLGRQYLFARELFGGRLDSATRINVFTRPGFLQEKLCLAHPCLHQQTDVMGAIEALRLKLNSSFRIAEENVKGIDRRVGGRLYHTFSSLAMDIHTDLARLASSMTVRSLAEVIDEEGIDLNDESLKI